MLGPFKNLFSRRLAKLQGKVPDYYNHEINGRQRYSIFSIVYEYEEKPGKLDYNYNEIREWKLLFEREFGKSVGFRDDKLIEYLSQCKLDEFLSALELLIIVKINHAKQNGEKWQRLSEFITKINKYFNIEKIGFEIVYVGDEELPLMIFPFESKFQFSETIQKPRSLLFNNQFSGALDEFDRALDDFRLGKFEDCIHKANKAYESTLKTILEKKGIGYKETDQIPALVKEVFKTDLIIKNAQTVFEGLNGLFNNGPNVIRNLEGIGHGQGEEIKKIEQSYAKFVINIVGSITVFLVERYEESK